MMANKLPRYSCLLLIIILSGFIPQKSSASELDSLVRVWNDTTLSDTSRLKAMLVFSNRRWAKHCSHDSLYLMGEQMVELAKKSDNLYYQSFGMRNQAFARLFTRQDEEVREILFRKNIIDSTRGNWWWMATNYNIIAETYSNDFQYHTAKDYLQKSMDIWKSKGYKTKMADNFDAMGRIQNAQGNYNKGLEYFKKALELAVEGGNETTISKRRGSLASVLALQGNYDTALTMLHEAIEVFKANNRPILVAMYGYGIGDIHSTLGNYEQARIYYDGYIEKYTEMDMPDAVARCRLQIGRDLTMQGKYAEALENYGASLRVFEGLDQKERIAHTYDRIGELNYHLGNYTKALEYYNKGLGIISSIDYNGGIADIYQHIGQVYTKLNDHESAMEYFNRSLVENKKIGYKHKISNVYRDIGASHKLSHDFTSAEKYFEKSRFIREEIGAKQGIAEIYIDLGNLLFEQEKWTQSFSFCKKGYDLALEMGLLKTEKDACLGLYKYYKKENDPVSALLFYERFLILKDSLNIDETSKKLERMEFIRQQTEDSLVLVEENLKSELAFKQQMSKEKNTRNTYMFGGFGVLLLAGGLFSRMIQVRKANIALETKNKIIAIEKKRVEESEKAKKKFFDNVSHEFRTPLTLILGPLDDVLARTTDTKLKPGLEIMQRNAERLQGMINELLDLSKLEFGKVKLQAREENIVELTQQYLQSFESLADQKKINLGFKSQTKDHKTFIDIEKYQKILANLLSNAFKFTNEGGRIDVGITSVDSSSKALLHKFSARPRRPGGDHIYDQARPSGSPMTNDKLPMTSDLTRDGILIKINDTGIGIPKDKLTHIFNRFYQVNDPDQSHHAGTGIGLALTKELVEMHGGTIDVESERGMGTSFTIFIPSGREHLTDDMIAKDKQIQELEMGIEADTLSWIVERDISLLSADEDSKNKNEFPTLLIVEDNPDMRAYIKSHLKERYSILEADNGELGLQKAIDEIPDLVISDVMMPEMDGYEMTERLKTDERTSHIPVIILTARVSIESKVEGLETGADAYITKPFHPKEIQVRVKNLIEQRDKLKSHFTRQLEMPDMQLEEDPRLSTTDRQFLQKAINIVNDRLSNPDFDARSFASELGLSRAQMYRKIKALTDKTTSEFIRAIKLNRAAQLLKKHTGNVSQVAYETGFTSISWFGKVFKQQFGVLPSEYKG